MKRGRKPVILNEEQEQFLRLAWGNVPVEKTARLLRMSNTTVYAWAATLGLPKLNGVGLRRNNGRNKT